MFSWFRQRWLWLLLLVPLGVGLGRLRFDADVLGLLPTDLPSVQGLRLHERYFANAHELLITVDSASSETSTEAAERIATTLEKRRDLVREVRWQPPWLERPADAMENLAWIWRQQPPEQVDALLERLKPDRLNAVLTEARDTLATSLDPQDLARTGYDPLGLSRLPNQDGLGSAFEQGVGIFVNDDGRFRVVRVEPAHAEMNYREAGVWLSEIRALAGSTVSPDKGVKFGFTGSPAFLAEVSQSMESDLRSSVLSTALLIAALFWLAHRTWRPLGWLILALAVTLLITLALGGLIWGTLNVISVGFAAVLMGLAVDYGLVSYQEAVAAPGVPPSEVRHEVSRGIWYSAGTTGGTFLLLGFTGLPGLAQLGQLTALGLLVGAMVMLYGFLPRVCPAPTAVTSKSGDPMEASAKTVATKPRSLLPTLGVLGLILVVLGFRGWPAMTASDDPLRPRSSSAYAAIDELKLRMGTEREPLRLVFRGTDPAEVGTQLEKVNRQLAASQTNGELKSFQLPTAFWPRPDYERTNQALLRNLVVRSNELQAAILNAGFAPPATELMRGLLAVWGSPSVGAAWPTNATARWLSGQFAARAENGDWLAMGAVFPSGETGSMHWEQALPAKVWVSSWETLSTRLFRHVEQRVMVLTGLIAVVLVGCLALAFGRVREVVLSGIALVLSFGLLLAAMSALGWSWNLLSLVALPLLLGSSVDSTIHVQLALRRHGGDRRAVWRTTGKALLLCAGANIAGFGSLAWSSNLGLASLDLVCAVGVGCVFVVCVGLLPAWWERFASAPPCPRVASSEPSALYGIRAWRAGLTLARILPASVAYRLADFGVAAYRSVCPQRAAVVRQNLFPVLEGSPQEVDRRVRENFRQFARKLVDLWRFEAGVPMERSVQPGQGWTHFSEAIASGRGVLMVTPHLGNWEFGALLLKQHQIRPLVLTAPEPGRSFTAARAAARSLQGIDTLVIGDDPFAFVQVIRRLQEGGLVALLLDRPRASTGVGVEFFGKPFQASVAVAELARATGSVVLPVYIVREGGEYRAHALAPVDYDRRTLGDRESRVAFTGRILRAFEPAVRQFADQWFHFVPVWPSGSPPVERSETSES